MFGWQCMQWGFCHPLRPLCNRCLKACKNCKLSYRKVYFDVTPPPELFSAGIPLKTEELQLCMFHPFFKPVSVTTTASVCKPLLQANWALLFWPTWLAEAVCKPKTFVVTETDFKHPRSSFRFCSPATKAICTRFCEKNSHNEKLCRDDKDVSHLKPRTI